VTRQVRTSALSGYGCEIPKQRVTRTAASADARFVGERTRRPLRSGRLVGAGKREKVASSSRSRFVVSSPFQAAMSPFLRLREAVRVLRR